MQIIDDRMRGEPVAINWPRKGYGPDGLWAMFDCAGDLPRGWSFDPIGSTGYRSQLKEERARCEARIIEIDRLLAPKANKAA